MRTLHPIRRTAPLLLALAASSSFAETSPRPAASATPPSAGVTPAVREAALARARVWLRPAVPPGEADLERNNPGGPRALLGDELVCTFRESQSRGQTPKFLCVMEDGEVVKVKSGKDNPEVFSEIAGARLLGALGFLTDEVYAIDRVRCLGCPPRPQDLSWWGRLLRRRPPEVVFEMAAVERRLPGHSLRSGWAWYELARVDARLGGASRAELDALRLMAVFLAHWDNKAENQRLSCQGGLAADGTCVEPVAFIRDVGGSFGPGKVDLARWRTIPIWTDRATCKVSLRKLPYRGGTFPDSRISERGRALLAGLLGQLSDAQIRGLFSGARFPLYMGHSSGGDDLEAWVAAFRAKVTEITENRCPE
jgi:hypothetical protein